MSVSFKSVLARMYKEKRTGVLELIAPDMELEIHLDGGNIVGLERVSGPSSRLTDMLLAREVIAINEGI